MLFRTSLFLVLLIFVAPKPVHAMHAAGSGVESSPRLLNALIGLGFSGMALGVVASALSGVSIDDADKDAALSDGDKKGVKQQLRAGTSLDAIASAASLAAGISAIYAYPQVFAPTFLAATIISGAGLGVNGNAYSTMKSTGEMTAMVVTNAAALAANFAGIIGSVAYFNSDRCCQ